LHPAPQLRDRIFSAAALGRLRDRFDVRDFEADPSLDLRALLPEAFAVVGQPDLDTGALDAAVRLRAIMNVEGNFFPNVDYAAAFRHGVRVLGCGRAYAQAVAEFSLGLAVDLARGITREDRAAREGRERYVSAATSDAILLHGARIGIIGFGNLAQAALPLLRAFSDRIQVFDPWLPASALREARVEPADLDSVLSGNEFLFVFATATAENGHLLDGRRLDLLPRGARLVLVSRAAVVDYDALLERLKAGRFLAGIDVWPDEPIAPDSPFRQLDNVIISPHRAGGIPQAFRQIGDMVVDDLELLANGLAPVRLQAAAPELVTRYRNRPVS
jgi:phosphoglycerate dehydrogenase-like enzyme